MIFVTVGTQLPFDRLIISIDRLAPMLGEPVIAQTGAGLYKPLNIEFRPVVHAIEFETIFCQARLIVSHAGIGSVLTAKRHGKPIVLFPRLAAFGEHRNDHQSATVSQLEGHPGIHIARCEEDLKHILSMSNLDQDSIGLNSVSRHDLTSHIRVIISSIANRVAPAH